MTERTITVPEDALKAELTRLIEQRDRLSAFVSGDVARARELAQALELALTHQRMHSSGAMAAEIVSLLTPPEARFADRTGDRA